MEHEVFIPVPAETLREALRDHARVARCVPGLQQDADESARPLSGRLKVRVGGHTITYRGALTLTERAGAFTAKGEGAEVRGTGSAKLNVRIRLRETAGGTTVAFTATSTSEGRLSEMVPATSEATARRLLDRFTTALGASGGVGEDGSAAGAAGAGGLAVGAADEAGSDRDVTASGATSGAKPDAAGAADSGSPGVDAGAGGSDGAADDAGQAPGAAGAARAGGAAADAAGSDRDATASGAAESGDNGPDDDSVAQTPDDSGADSDSDADEGESDADDEDSDIAASAEDPDVPDPGDFDAPVPPSALDASVEFGVTASGEGDFLVPLDPPAEAAHARRTMIGRSAEEVDHAPPRGRYAPERAPDTGGAGAALRWVAPAAALAIAGAVVVGRALRRRR